jgi:electron transport complex protein RnfE
MAQGWVLHVIPDYKGFLLAILPPGAFIGLGLLIAGKNWLNLRAEAKARNKPVSAPMAGEAAQG